MCDYSLHAVSSRPAEVAETLVSTKFRSTTTRGFANPDNPTVAVCLRPGTEIALRRMSERVVFCFGEKFRRGWLGFGRSDFDYAAQHHDALEFSNGAIVLLTDLVPGQRAIVLQLPANRLSQSQACLNLPVK